MRVETASGQHLLMQESQVSLQLQLKWRHSCAIGAEQCSYAARLEAKFAFNLLNC